MKKTTDVRIWSIRPNKSKTPSYEIRWKTGPRPHSATRRTKALAVAFRSNLHQATKRGAEFHIESGLPDSMLTATTGPIRTVLMTAHAYVEMRWPRSAPKSRDGITDALATLIPALTADQPDRPSKEELRTVLRTHALLPTSRRTNPTPEIARTLRWLESAVMPITDLGQTRFLRVALDALTVNLDGTASSASSTIGRKRAVLFSFLEYATELGDLPANLLATMKWTPPKTNQTVDPRCRGQPHPAHNLLVVRHLRRPSGQCVKPAAWSAMFACMYYAAMRPSEAINVKKNDCHLPDTGWGTITLARSRPEVNIRWSDTGETHEERQLKHRAADDVRPIPIPPALVRILRTHIAHYGVTTDGWLFQTERGGPIGSTAYTQVWQEARPLALTPEQAGSPMAGRPYDVRH